MEEANAVASMKKQCLRCFREPPLHGPSPHWMRCASRVRKFMRDADTTLQNRQGYLADVREVGDKMVACACGGQDVARTRADDVASAQAH